MSKDVDFFFDMHICVEDREQGEDLENLIEDNKGLIADWDIEFLDAGGNPIEGSIIDIQFQSFEAVAAFGKLLIEGGYTI
jgi:hypothetical protein